MTTTTCVISIAEFGGTWKKRGNLTCQVYSISATGTEYQGHGPKRASVRQQKFPTKTSLVYTVGTRRITGCDHFQLRPGGILGGKKDAAAANSHLTWSHGQEIRRQTRVVVECSVEWRSPPWRRWLGPIIVALFLTGERQLASTIQGPTDFILKLFIQIDGEQQRSRLEDACTGQISHGFSSVCTIS